MMDDLDRIMEVMAAAFDPQWGEVWTRSQLGSSLSLPSTHYRLVNAPDEKKGSAGFTLVRAAPGEEELLLIAVKPEFRGCGIGRRLLEAFAADARARGAERLFLEMRENNPADRLYRSVGFRQIGRRERYYTMPDGRRLDAITFALDL